MHKSEVSCCHSHDCHALNLAGRPSLEPATTTMARRNRVITSDDDGSQDGYDSTPDPAVKLRRIVPAPALDDMEDEEEEEEEAVDQDQEPDGALEEDEGDEVEEEEEEEEAYDDEVDSDDLNIGKSSTPQRFSIVIKRKSRGGGALSKGSGSRGRGLPRGRPRGRPRGAAAGRGRGVLPHGMLVVQKPGSTPKPEANDDDDDETYGEPSTSASAGASRTYFSSPVSCMLNCSLLLLVNTNLPIGTTYRQIGGKTYVFQDDELVTEEDEVGNTKIDINGNLLGGTLYLCLHYTITIRAQTGFVSQDERLKPIHSAVHGDPTPRNDTCCPSKLREHLGSETRCITSVEIPSS